MKFLKNPIVIVLLVAVFFFLVGLWWLSLMLILATGLYSLKYTDWVAIRFLKRYSIVSYPLMFLGVVLFAVWMRVFIFEIFVVPSSSMEDTILPGDKIIVNKLNYGPKMPRSPFEIPWLNLFFFLNPTTRNLSDSVWWDFRRLSGFTNYKNGDIIVFSHPYYDGAFIKRCMALPGDTLQIKNGKVFINSLLFEEEVSVKRWHSIWCNNNSDIDKYLDSLNIYSRNSKQNSSADVLINNGMATILSNMPGVDSLKIRSIAKDSTSWTFPGKNEHDQINWSIDIFGPLVIPKKNTTIPMDIYNFNLYSNIINQNEGLENQLTFKNHKFYLGRNEIKKYTFEKDYFFIVGDNRHDSNDSRYWGPIPEENIIGKASLILFSNDLTGFKLNRMFQTLK